MVREMKKMVAGVRQAVRRRVAVRGGRQLRVLLHPHQRHLHLLLPRAPLLPPLQGRRRRRILNGR